MQIVVVLTPYVVLTFLIYYRNYFPDQKQTKDISRWRALFSDFKYNKGWPYLMMCPLFYARRLLYLLLLVYAGDEPYIQVYFTLAMSIGMLCYMGYYQPFGSRLLFFASFASELGIASVLITAAQYIHASSGAEQSGYTWTIISVVSTIIGICFGCLVYMTIRNLVMIVKETEDAPDAKTHPEEQSSVELFAPQTITTRLQLHALNNTVESMPLDTSQEVGQNQTMGEINTMQEMFDDYIKD